MFKWLINATGNPLLPDDHPVFGFVECDIEVPRNTPHALDPSRDLWADVFDERCPLFFNAEVGIDDVSPLMKTYAQERGELKRPRRLLVAGHKAQKVLLITPLFRWYIERGLVVTKIYQVVQYELKRVFALSSKTALKRDDAATSKGLGQTPNY